MASPGSAPLRDPDSAAVTDWADEATERLVLCLLRARVPRHREALRTTRAKRILCQLRRYAVLSSLLSGLGSVSVISIVARGSAALVASGGPPCRGPLREWLVCFGPVTWLQGLAPLCVLLAALARCESHHAGWAFLQHCWPLLSVCLFCWCAAVATSVRPPASCRALDGLTFEIVALQCLSSCVVVTTDVCLLEAQPLLKKLGGILSGRATAEAANFVAQLPGCPAPADEECCICLGCAEEDEEDPLRGALTGEGADTEVAQDAELRPADPRWLRLPCGHAFHRGCLLQWVVKARSVASKHCPVCRRCFRESARASRLARAVPGPAAPAPAPAAASPLLGVRAEGTGGAGGAGGAAGGACGLETAEGTGALSSGSAIA